MTTPIPLGTISMDLVTDVLLADSWLAIEEGSLSIMKTPYFFDGITGQLAAPAEDWFQFTGTDGEVYAVPSRSLGGVKLATPSPEVPQPVNESA